MTSSQWLHSSVVERLHRNRKGHGFESRWSLNFFFRPSFQLLKLIYNCESHSLSFFPPQFTYMNYLMYSSSPVFVFVFQGRERLGWKVDGVRLIQRIWSVHPRAARGPTMTDIHFIEHPWKGLFSINIKIHKIHSRSPRFQKIERMWIAAFNQAVPSCRVGIRYFINFIFHQTRNQQTEKKEWWAEQSGERRTTETWTGRRVQCERVRTTVNCPLTPYGSFK